MVGSVASVSVPLVDDPDLIPAVTVAKAVRPDGLAVKLVSMVAKAVIPVGLAVKLDDSAVIPVDLVVTELEPELIVLVPGLNERVLNFFRHHHRHLHYYVILLPRHLREILRRLHVGLPLRQM